LVPEGRSVQNRPYAELRSSTIRCYNIIIDPLP